MSLGCQPHSDIFNGEGHIEGVEAAQPAVRGERQETNPVPQEIPFYDEIQVG